MSLFHGVHEVRLIRPSIASGYFDSWDAALEAVETEPEYKAAYFTLNPVEVPAGVAVNPASLKASKNTAADANIARRVWLLIDLDPARAAGTNATDAEKQSAREQADAARNYLAARGWPEPVLADSGNGWHLLYRVDLPNDAASSELVRSVLARLKHLFPLVDSGNFNASRVCKLYGSWARKGPHSEERPHRRSAIVEAGKDDVVTVEQLRQLIPTTPEVVLAKPDDVKLAGLVGFLSHYSVVSRSEPREVSGGWQIAVQCPWIDEHSSEANRDTVVSFIAGIGYGFKCFHSHCTEKRWREFREELERRSPGLAAYFGKLPAMTHSDIARDFARTHDDFVSVYDAGNETGVWLPGTRWRLSDPRDTNLRRAIRRHLDELFDRYPKPEPDAKDTRVRLKDSNFTNGVLSELRPLLPPKSSNDFDRDPAILPLPDGKVADLRAGTIREMRREDCQTRRLKVAPAPMATPRWDRFLREITCDDAELASYVERLMAIAITGLSLHQLIFFYGSGRNGKGVLLRLLSKILRGETFVVNIRPEELEYRRGAEDKAKRLFGRLKGARLAFTSETVSGGLDWTLLKLLTGGDALAGAKVYQDDSSFDPTHTLVLTTNDRPVLPATAAFKGRLRFVPFRADFSGREDLHLEDALALEMPGILWRLIKLAPFVFEGDNPPAVVVDATQDVLDENDVARPFIDSCLVVDADAVTPIVEIEEAARKWKGGIVADDVDLDRIMQGVKAKWIYGRKRAPGRANPVRGLVGVRLVAS
jgi:P4 family phage/plasmid primase-like protien